MTTEKSASIEYRVPYADTDMMGVVYYGNYLTLFERCRNELMRKTGMTYKQLEIDGAMLPVIEAHVNYKHPAKYDDLLKVTAWMDLIEGARIRIKCTVECDGVLLATGHTVHCCVSTKTMRPMRIPKFMIDFGTMPTDSKYGDE